MKNLLSLLFLTLTFTINANVHFQPREYNEDFLGENELKMNEECNILFSPQNIIKYKMSTEGLYILYDDPDANVWDIEILVQNQYVQELIFQYLYANECKKYWMIDHLFENIYITYNTINNQFIIQ